METSAQKWTKLAEDTIDDCRVFKVDRVRFRNDLDQKERDFFVIKSPDWVNIVAYTKDDNVVLIRQFRFGVDDHELELPGGLIDDGEDPLAAAKRELLEETGYSSDNWKLTGESHPNPAIQSNTIFHFAAFACEKNDDTRFDADESIETILMPKGSIAELTLTGKIRHSLVVAAFYYAANWVK